MIFQITIIFQKGNNKYYIKCRRKNLKVIMTEKDYYKINKFQLNKIEYLKVSLEVNEKEKLFKIIKKNL